MSIPHAFFRPLIGPEITLSVQGLSLPPPPRLNWKLPQMGRVHLTYLHDSWSLKNKELSGLDLWSCLTRGLSSHRALKRGGVPNWNQIYIYIFNASALWADAFYKLKCPCVCVCPSVHPSVYFLRYRLNIFLPPLPPPKKYIYLKIRSPTVLM